MLDGLQVEKGQTRDDKPAVVRHSFVVRIWREASLPRWRGWVQEARTGEAAFVRELDELSTFIEHRTGGWVDPSPQCSELSRAESRLG
jgi:hypothetical protein